MTLNDLKTLILKKYKTARRFASKVGLTESMVSYILSGKRKFYSWNADNFAKVLDVDRNLLDRLVSDTK